MLASEVTGYGSVYGEVTYNGEPVQMATVVVKPLKSYCALGLYGEFQIDSIPAGYYSIEVVIMDMLPSAGTLFSISNGESVYLPIVLDFAATPPWPPYFTNRSDTLILRSSDGSFARDGFQLWSDSIYVPIRTIDDSTVIALIPDFAGEIGYSLPGSSEVILCDYNDLGDTVVSVSSAPTCHRNESGGILPLDPHEYLNPNYSLRRECIDLSEWGDDELVNLGFLGFNVSFMDSVSNDAFLLFLFYRDRLIVLDESYSVTRYDYPFPVRNYNISGSGQYVALFHDIGFGHHGGDVAVLDTRSGDIVRLDPTPERDEPDPWMSSAFNSSRCYSHFLLNSGEIVRVFDGWMLISSTDDEGVVTNEVVSEYISSKYQVITEFNDENTIWLCTRINDSAFLTEFSSSGEIHNQYQVLGDIWDPNPVVLLASGNPGMLFYADMSGLYYELAFAGLPILQNCLRGDYIKEFQVSPNLNYLLHVTNTQNGYYPTITNFVERSSVSLEFSSEWNFCYLRGISDTGYSFIVYENARSSGYPPDFRNALYDKFGELVWAGPIRKRQPCIVEQDWKSPADAVSSDGSTIVYIDGTIINVVRIEI